MTDPKVFSKNFKNCLLDSVVSDPNYIVNNAYDYIYNVKLIILNGIFLDVVMPDYIYIAL